MQVRDGAGPEGLALYHADERAGPGAIRVARRNFADELRSGRYRLAVVRRLHRRLTPAQADLVREFAAMNVGKESRRAPAPASVLQVGAICCVTPRDLAPPCAAASLLPGFSAFPRFNQPGMMCCTSYLSCP